MNEKLALLDFGRGAAQQEENLRDFFFKSGSYQSAVSRDIYLILGAKGAGKSAIFQRLKDEAGTISTFQSPSAVVVDEPFSLRDLYPTISKISTSRPNLWKLYFASLAAGQIVNAHSEAGELADTCKRFLARWGLVGEVPTKWQSLKNIKVNVGWGDIIKTEFPAKAELTVGEIDTVLIGVSKYFAEKSGSLWICIDSLDEVTLNGATSPSTEDILGDCMKAVGEVIRYPGIKFKLFFRTDIYNRLTYVNKDHFSSSKIELKWARNDLAILLAHRLSKLHPEHTANVSAAIADKWINEVFTWNASPAGFDDLYSKLQDGLGNVQPRDLVHFCIQAQRHQNTFDVQETNPPAAGRLISSQAASEALDETANAKLTDFLNVFKMYSSTIDQLRGHPKSQLLRGDLEAAFGKSAIDSALIIADLWQVGVIKILDKKTINQAQQFEVPYLYARALNLGS